MIATVSHSLPDEPPTGIPDVVGWLLDALGAAVHRRSAAGRRWRDRADAALAVARADYSGDAGAAVNRALLEVGSCFRLDTTDLRLLTVAIAVELDPTLQLLVGLLGGDRRIERPTSAVALELAGIGFLSVSERARLGSLGFLPRYGLLTVEGDGPLLSRRLRAAERIVGRVLGDPHPDPALEALITALTGSALAGTDAVADALRRGEPLVWVDSPLLSAGAAVAAAACAAVGAGVLALDLRRAPAAAHGAALPSAAHPSGDVPSGDVPSGNVPFAELIRRAGVEAALRGCVLVLLGADRAAPTAAAALSDAVVPVVGVSPVGWDPAWSDRLPALVSPAAFEPQHREPAWRAATAGRVVDPAVLGVPLDPIEIRLIGHRAAEDVGDGEPITLPDVRRILRQIGSRRASRSHPTSLADVVLPGDVRAELDRLLSWMRHRDERWAQRLFAASSQAGGICALFSGSPGTGKTLTAHAIADSLGLELLAVDLSTVVDKYIGETEKHLERAFAEAENNNALLFFDEADALFGSRSAVRDAHDRYANQEVAYLLQRIERSRGLTILATNLRGNIDPAFARRLQFIVHFSDPDASTRRRLWEHYLARAELTRDPDDPVDVPRLAEALECNGSDVFNIVLAAAFDSVSQGAALGMRHLRSAVSREYVRLGRRVPTV